MKRQQNERKIFKWCDQQGIYKLYKQLIQRSIKKTPNDPIKKMGSSKQPFLQKRYIDGQQAHEKMFNLTKY